MILMIFMAVPLPVTENKNKNIINSIVVLIIAVIHYEPKWILLK